MAEESAPLLGRETRAAAPKTYPCALVASKRIVRAELYERLPFSARLYAWPFALAYTVWSAAAARAWLAGTWDDLYYAPLAIVGAAHALALLACQWSVAADALITCTRVSLAHGAAPVPGRHMLALHPRAHAGRAALVRVTEAGGVPSVEHQQQRFVWRGGRFEKVRYPVAQAVGAYVRRRVSAPEDASLYGANAFAIPQATFAELFREHAVAPFFVFQVFCVALWCLDDYWYYSLFTLAMLVVFESTVVMQRIKSTNEFRAMALPVVPLAVRRGANAAWTEMPSDALLPGDVVVLTMPPVPAAERGQKEAPAAELTVPCDIVLVAGSAVANEAMISGESTPLLKEALAVCGDAYRPLDVRDADRLHVLFGGTKVLQFGELSSAAIDFEGDITGLTGPDNVLGEGGCKSNYAPGSSDNVTGSSDNVTGSSDQVTGFSNEGTGSSNGVTGGGGKAEGRRAAVGIVVRTGFGTLQGRLVRTMVHSAERMSANNAEAFAFIAFLLVFALAAAAYVLYWTWGEPGRSHFKLVVEAVLIITAVVPPELPMELSLAVNNSLMALGKHAIFCMEPFRIPLAGRLDVLCFDKTGTLTAENLVVRGVVLAEDLVGATDDAPLAVCDDADDLPADAALVLGTCHALFRIDGRTVGDPMERAALDFAGWASLGADVFARRADGAPPKDGAVTARILARHQFSSALRRMSCVVQRIDGRTGAKDTRVVVKGAPEVVEAMLDWAACAGVTPAAYAAAHRRLANSGARVLALAWRPADAAAACAPRADAERRLCFAGFLVFHCPLKADSRAAVVALQDSLHRVAMVTGDNVLTAVHAARELRIVWRPVRALEWCPSRSSLVVCDVSAAAAHEYVSGASGAVSGQGAGEKTYVPIGDIPGGLRALGFDFCMCGNAVDATADVRLPGGGTVLAAVAPMTAVFARTSPAQKESVLCALKAAGLTTLMCGDGTNDVGALKQAHVGVALLDGKPEDLPRILRQMQQVAVRRAQLSVERSRLALEHLARGGPAGGAAAARAAEMQRRVDEMAARLEEAEAPIVRLGDASVAAPFTSKIGTAEAVCRIVRQGRAALAATMQMYKILALNSLIAAYGLSVLHLEAVRYGDFQATLSGMLLAACFMFLAKAQPVERLAARRPQPTIFNAYVAASVLGQFALHLGALAWVVAVSNRWAFRTSCVAAAGRAKFVPGLLNTTVFLVSLLMQVSTFVVNYQGHPFRESLAENAPLRTALLAVAAVAIAAAAELFPDANAYAELVPMPPAVRTRLLVAMAVDFGGCLVVEYVAKRLLFDGSPRIPLDLLRPA